MGLRRVDQKQRIKRILVDRFDGEAIMSSGGELEEDRKRKKCHRYVFFRVMGI